MPSPQRLFHCLAEELRLLTVLLIHRQGELCVCELVVALEQKQPKISRHLAQLRHCNLLQDRRRGQWVFYRVHPGLAPWALAILEQAGAAEDSRLRLMEQRLTAMQGRPERTAAHG